MASTNKTPQLGLNQWAAGDSVLREDFNGDNLKIEAGIEAAPARAHVVGKFTGDGVIPRKIDLGFAPSALISFTDDSNGSGRLYISTKYGYGLICSSGSLIVRYGTMVPELSSTGFSISDRNVGNFLHNEFYYIAFR